MASDHVSSHRLNTSSCRESCSRSTEFQNKIAAIVASDLPLNALVEMLITMKVLRSIHTQKNLPTLTVQTFRGIAIRF
jgi:hypothetical protein